MSKLKVLPELQSGGLYLLIEKVSVMGCISAIRCAINRSYCTSRRLYNYTWVMKDIQLKAHLKIPMHHLVRYYEW